MAQMGRFVNGDLVDQVLSCRYRRLRWVVRSVALTFRIVSSFSLRSSHSLHASTQTMWGSVGVMRNNLRQPSICHVHI